MTKIIDGKQIALQKEAELKKKVNRPVALLSLVAKEDKLGLLYTRLKKEAAERIGIKFYQQLFSLKDLNAALTLINQSAKKTLNGLIVQKPDQSLIRQYFASKEEFKTWWLKMVSQIPEAIDVDALNPVTLGQIVIGKAKFYPATVMAVWQVLLMAFSEKELSGKTAVIVGSSEILGKPLALLLRDKGMTVTLLGASCRDLGEFTRQADAVISGVGKQNLIKAEMVKDGVVVIDVAGDVDFEAVAKKASLITPPTGGIGPLTVVNLLANVMGS